MDSFVRPTNRIDCSPNSTMSFFGDGSTPLTDVERGSICPIVRVIRRFISSYQIMLIQHGALLAKKLYTREWLSRNDPACGGASFRETICPTDRPGARTIHPSSLMMRMRTGRHGFPAFRCGQQIDAVHGNGLEHFFGEILNQMKKII